MIYGKYKNARDAAWLGLIEHGINQLPIHVLDITKVLNISVWKYSREE